MSLTITLGLENPIAAAADVHPFRFADGTLCVWKSNAAPSGDSYWSADDGGTWSGAAIGGRAQPGPISSTTGEQAATYINGELHIISMRGTCSGAASPYVIDFRKSTNDWVNVDNDFGSVEAPDAKPYIGDAGDINPSYIFHHGFSFTLDGRLIGTFFGCNVGDDTPFDGYPTFTPPGVPCNKSRTMVLFSEHPYGDAWDDVVTIGYDQCFARGTQPDPQPWDVAIAVPVTQEGFNEADVERLADGTYFAIMRTGSRKGIVAGPVPWTSLYGARSVDGVTWKLPRALMLDSATPIVSASPKLVVLGNGVLALLYCAPNAYIVFSSDNGETWSNRTELGTSENDLGGVQVGWNTVLAVYYSVVLGTFVARQVVADVDGFETTPSIQIIATPPVVKSGQSALLQWFSNNVTAMDIDGGPYNNLSITPNSYITTGPLTVDTSFTISGTGGVGGPIDEGVTIVVVP